MNRLRMVQAPTQWTWYAALLWGILVVSLLWIPSTAAQETKECPSGVGIKEVTYSSDCLTTYPIDVDWTDRKSVKNLHCPQAQLVLRTTGNFLSRNATLGWHLCFSNISVKEIQVNSASQWGGMNLLIYNSQVTAVTFFQADLLQSTIDIFNVTSSFNSLPPPSSPVNGNVISTQNPWGIPLLFSQSTVQQTQLHVSNSNFLQNIVVPPNGLNFSSVVRFTNCSTAAALNLTFRESNVSSFSAQKALYFIEFDNMPMIQNASISVSNSHIQLATSIAWAYGIYVSAVPLVNNLDILVTGRSSMFLNSTSAASIAVFRQTVMTALNFTVQETTMNASVVGIEAEGSFAGFLMGTIANFSNSNILVSYSILNSTLEYTGAAHVIGSAGCHWSSSAIVFTMGDLYVGTQGSSDTARVEGFAFNTSTVNGLRLNVTGEHTEYAERETKRINFKAYSHETAFVLFNKSSVNDFELVVAHANGIVSSEGYILNYNNKYGNQTHLLRLLDCPQFSTSTLRVLGSRFSTTKLSLLGVRQAFLVRADNSVVTQFSAYFFTHQIGSGGVTVSSSVMTSGTSAGWQTSAFHFTNTQLSDATIDMESGTRYTVNTGMWYGNSSLLCVEGSLPVARVSVSLKQNSRFEMSGHGMFSAFNFNVPTISDLTILLTGSSMIQTRVSRAVVSLARFKSPGGVNNFSCTLESSSSLAFSQTTGMVAFPRRLPKAIRVIWVEGGTSLRNFSYRQQGGTLLLDGVARRSTFTETDYELLFMAPAEEVTAPIPVSRKFNKLLVTGAPVAAQSTHKNLKFSFTQGVKITYRFGAEHDSDIPSHLFLVKGQKAFEDVTVVFEAVKMIVDAESGSQGGFKMFRFEDDTINTNTLNLTNFEIEIAQQSEIIAEAKKRSKTPRDFVPLNFLEIRSKNGNFEHMKLTVSNRSKILFGSRFEQLGSAMYPASLFVCRDSSYQTLNVTIDNSTIETFAPKSYVRLFDLGPVSSQVTMNEPGSISFESGSFITLRSTCNQTSCQSNHTPSDGFRAPHNVVFFQEISQITAALRNPSFSISDCTVRIDGGLSVDHSRVVVITDRSTSNTLVGNGAFELRNSDIELVARLTSIHIDLQAYKVSNSRVVVNNCKILLRASQSSAVVRAGVGNVDAPNRLSLLQSTSYQLIDSKVTIEPLKQRLRWKVALQNSNANDLKESYALQIVGDCSNAVVIIRGCTISTRSQSHDLLYFDSVVGSATGDAMIIPNVNITIEAIVLHAEVSTAFSAVSWSGELERNQSTKGINIQDSLIQATVLAATADTNPASLSNFSLSSWHLVRAINETRAPHAYHLQAVAEALPIVVLRSTAVLRLAGGDGPSTSSGRVEFGNVFLSKPKVGITMEELKVIVERNPLAIQSDAAPNPMAILLFDPKDNFTGYNDKTPLINSIRVVNSSFAGLDVGSMPIDAALFPRIPNIELSCSVFNGHRLLSKDFLNYTSLATIQYTPVSEADAAIQCPISDTLTKSFLSTRSNSKSLPSTTSTSRSPSHTKSSEPSSSNSISASASNGTPSPSSSMSESENTHSITRGTLSASLTLPATVSPSSTETSTIGSPTRSPEQTKSSPLSPSLSIDTPSTTSSRSVSKTPSESQTMSLSNTASKSSSKTTSKNTQSASKGTVSATGATASISDSSSRSKQTSTLSNSGGSRTQSQSLSVEPSRSKSSSLTASEGSLSNSASGGASSTMSHSTSSQPSVSLSLSVLPTPTFTKKSTRSLSFEATPSRSSSLSLGSMTPSRQKTRSGTENSPTKVHTDTLSLLPTVTVTFTVSDIVAPSASVTQTVTQSATMSGETITESNLTTPSTTLSSSLEVSIPHCPPEENHKLLILSIGKPKYVKFSNETLAPAQREGEETKGDGGDDEKKGPVYSTTQPEIDLNVLQQNAVTIILSTSSQFAYNSIVSHFVTIEGDFFSEFGIDLKTTVNITEDPFNRTLVNITIGPWPALDLEASRDFFVVVDELVMGCRGMKSSERRKAITILAERPTFVRLAAALSQASTTVSAVGGGAAAPGVLLDAQALAAFSLIQCSSEGNRYAMKKANILLSPWQFGPAPEGSINGNLLIVCGIAVLHSLVMLLLWLKKKKQFDVAGGMARFPSLTYTLMMMFHQGTTILSFRLLVDGRASPIAVAGVLWGLFFPIICIFKVFLPLYKPFRPWDLSVEPTEKLTCFRYDKEICTSWPKNRFFDSLRKLLLPVARWGGPHMRKRFGGPGGSLLSTHTLWMLIPPIQAVTVSVVAGLPVISRAKCIGQHVALIAFFLILAVIHIHQRPNRANIIWIFQALSYSTLALLLGMSLGRALSPRNPTLQGVSSVVMMFQLVLSIARTVYGITIKVCERCFWAQSAATCLWTPSYFLEVELERKRKKSMLKRAKKQQQELEKKKKKRRAMMEKVEGSHRIHPEDLPLDDEGLLFNSPPRFDFKTARAADIPYDMVYKPVSEFVLDSSDDDDEKHYGNLQKKNQAGTEERRKLGGGGKKSELDELLLSIKDVEVEDEHTQKYQDHLPPAPLIEPRASATRAFWRKGGLSESEVNQSLYEMSSVFDREEGKEEEGENGRSDKKVWTDSDDEIEEMVQKQVSEREKANLVRSSFAQKGLSPRPHAVAVGGSIGVSTDASSDSDSPKNENHGKKKLQQNTKKRTGEKDAMEEPAPGFGGAISHAIDMLF